ncbi:MAG TPA: efflux RND transporter periplasmic adaptor subunit, partial [Gemmatimonadaceae bacterium]|nr:efflux RND transporter periplasmic adaptor subunit [Gemmatimonadaceae bacterium]
MYRNADAHEAPTYRFTSVTRGNLESTVSATGALRAVTTVQVGTQVSGLVRQIKVDFNDRVKKGQLLATIDPTLQQQAVLDAQAGLVRAQADLERSRSEYNRNKTLFDQKVLTATEFNTAQYNYTVAQASVKSAQVALDRARKNLSYTEIYAPIDGVVVERNVDVGQTVAASLSAPQLFLIANDLSQMQILASVDESDIGQIHDGQDVRFTVQAYANQNFTGTVRQVRLQSATTENVVNYTVVVAVANPKGNLLPGMTATVEFLTGSAQNALIVPNAALRFRATPEMMAEAGVPAAGTGAPRTAADSAAFAARRDSMQKARAASGQTAGGQAAGGQANGAQRQGGTGAAGGTRSRASGGRGSMAQLWYVAANGKPAVVRVRTGLSDGQNTEVTGQNLKEGMQV